MHAVSPVYVPCRFAPARAEPPAATTAGVKVSDGPRLEGLGLEVSSVARRATEAYLIQILRHGFFHADPHPGNVAVDAEGRLLYYDFGGSPGSPCGGACCVLNLLLRSGGHARPLLPKSKA
jgi:hypothetical protein